MYQKIALTLLLCSVLASHAKSQSPAFYEVIKEDSIKLFYNESFHLTNSTCSTIIRYTRADTEGNFIGNYVDIYNHDVVLGKGMYTKGVRDGYFEIYHPNGKIQSRGNYKSGRPTGLWEFFYENGLPERTLNVTDTAALLIRFVGEKGDLLVENGNGKFDGLVGANSKVDNSIRAKGRIANGRPDGKWSSVMVNFPMAFCNEEFKNGRFVKGIFPQPNGIGERKYTDQSFLDTFFLNNYLGAAESFAYTPCPALDDSPKVTSGTKDNGQADYEFDINRFNTDLMAKLNRVIEEDFRQGRSELYVEGDNYLTIKFSVDEKGKAFDFKTITSWGYPLERTVHSAIKNNAKFPPGSGPLYFHLKVSLIGGGNYKVNFQFSKNISPHG